MRLERLPGDAWTVIGEPTGEEGRHFFFRFKDETFECDAHRLDFQGSCGFDMTDARTVS